jgi:ParB-like chromosome segregation protein Spo0J
MAKSIKNKEIQIENLDTEFLIPYINNTKIHPDSQIDKIAGSISEFGFLNPIILDKNNNIIAGHGRLLAAKKLKIKIVPCLRAEHLTPSQVKAYRIADNKLNELGEWDLELLKIELDFLKDENFDLELTGFELEEVKSLMAENNNISQTLPSKLIDKFIIPPFSVLDTRQGYWQDRKRQWLSLGIKSELGRGGEPLTFHDHKWMKDKLGKIQAPH